MAQREARRDAVGEAAEVLTYALSERFECLEAGAAPSRVDADAPGAVVIDGDEHRHLTLSCRSAKETLVSLIAMVQQVACDACPP
jgi:hypothetical protein